MSTRQDLLALDADKLAVLANRGIVKRVSRELDTGKAPELSVEPDGTVIAAMEGVITRLTPGTPLSETPCTCGARTACRHRVHAVLAYQAVFGSQPSEEVAKRPSFDGAALAALLDERTLGRAEKARDRGCVADVVLGDAPAVELASCTVRFLVANDLAYARCDCQIGQRCEHVALAVWALNEAAGREGERITVELGARTAVHEEALGPLSSLARQLVLEGVEGSSALSVRFAQARDPLERAGLRWPSTIADELEEVLASYAGRRASYRPERLAALVTELEARARAGLGGGALPPGLLLGMHEPARTKLDHVRLVSLGVRLDREVLSPDRASVRADVYLADPDTLTVLVASRTWEVPEDQVGAALSSRPMVSQATLGVLARGQVVTRAAERSANRAVTIGTQRVAPTTVTPSSGRWERFGEPLGYSRYAALDAQLAARPPAFVRPRLLSDRVQVLAVHAVEGVVYHPGEQVLRATLIDAEGFAVDVALEHRLVAPGALDALALALNGHYGEPRFVSGEVKRAGGRLIVTPLAVAAGDRVLALDLEAPERASSLAIDEGEREVDAHASALASVQDHLDLGAHTGLLHARDAWVERLAALAEQLGELGLRGCAERARELHAGMSARLGNDEAARADVSRAWLEASLRVRLALEAS